MSPLVTEHLNGGLVGSRDPYELRPGELQQSDECVYRLHDPAIHGRPGRTQYNTTTIKDGSGTTCPVKGLSHLSFENVHSDQILAMGGTDTVATTDSGLGTLWAGDFTTIAGSATFTKITGPGQVTDAAINNSTTVTSASGGFANMVPGARIIGTGIPSGSLVITVTSSTSIVISNTTTGGSQTVTATFDMGIAATPADFGGEIMDVAQWGGAYYFVGAGTSERIYYKGRGSLTSGGTSVSLTDLLIARPVGLMPVTLAPTVATTAGAWNTSTTFGAGVYWFLYTEIYNPGGADEVEGTYINTDDKGTKLGPVAVTITTPASQGVLITRNAQVNDGSTGVHGRLSTHWVIYMSPKQADATVTPSLATFTRVATVSMYTNTGAANTSFTLTSPTLDPRVGYATAVAAVAARNQFAGATRLSGAWDNLVAFSDSGAGHAGSNSNAINKLQSFSFTGLDATYTSASVTGVKVEIRCAALQSSGFFLYLRTTGGKVAAPLWGTVDGFNLQTKSFGDSADTQGTNFAASDFASGGGFEVWVEKPGSNKDQILYVDGVKVTVYYTGTNINNNGRPFRVITYRDAIGFTIDEPARLNPPDSTTIDTFQGSLIANDVANPSQIRWSLPGEPEAWPLSYSATMTTRKDDTVTCVKRLNTIMIVATKEEVHRLNYLPSEADTDFKEGLSHETLSEDLGIVGPLAAVRYSRPGGGTHLAFVSFGGFHDTDGVTVDFLTRDIKVRNFIDPTYISKCIFRNYPKERWLVLFYTPVGGTYNSKALIFTYDQLKEDGSLRVIGPISVNARSACDATLTGTPILLTGHRSGGTIWTEDQGADVTGYTIDGSTQLVAAPSIISRRFYPAGMDRLARTERQYMQHDANGTQVSMTSVVMTAGSATLTRAAGWSGVVRGMRLVHTNLPGDTVVLSVSGTTVTASQSAFETVTDTVLADKGTVSITVRGQKIGTAVAEIKTSYSSTFTGGLLKTSIDAQSQGFDVMIEKVRMSDSDTLTDLNTALRIHHFTYNFDDAGLEQTRAGAL